MKNILIITVLLLTSTTVFAQKYTSESKKAIKHYEEALHAYSGYHLELAAERMQKAIKADDKFIEAYIVLGEIYTDLQKADEAIDTYKKAIEVNKDFYPVLHYNLGNLQMKVAKYKEALHSYDTFLEYKNMKPDIRKASKRRQESCLFAIDAMANPVPFNPVNLGDNINTNYAEYWPTITADEQILFFTRLITKDKEYIKEIKSNPGYDPKKTMVDTLQEDFFISLKKDGVWQMAQNVGAPLNTPGNEGAQSISVIGTKVYYTGCNKSGGFGRCDIYESEYVDGHWSESRNLGSKVNKRSWDAQPAISPDGKTLYFVSNREGGYGRNDIWMCNMLPNGEWSEAINLGDSINTPGDEMSPFIHADNKTLYFSSNFRVGMGGYDIFKSTKDENGIWTNTMNIGYPINTIHDETGLIVNASGNVAYYSSNKFSDKDRDIFSFEMPVKARPTPVSYMKGKVFDKKTKKALAAEFKLISLENGKEIMNAFSDWKTGEFLVCIPSDMDYALNVSREGYLFYSDNFSMKGIFDATDPFLKDVPLQAIEVGQKIILRNIFYEHDSYKLDQKSMVELAKLQAFLEKNPNLKVEISGHTDNVGDDSYNIILSENRAKSVYEYLIENGIDVSRLSYKGYGESEPIESNDNEKGRAANRRTEVKVLGQ